MTNRAANDEPLIGPMHFRNFVPLLADALFYASESYTAQERGEAYREASATRMCIASCAFAMESAVNCALKKYAPTDFEWRQKENEKLFEKIPLAIFWATGEQVGISSKPIADALEIYRLRNMLAHPKDAPSGVTWKNPTEADECKREIVVKVPRKKIKGFAAYVYGWGAYEAGTSAAALLTFLTFFFGDALRLTPGEVAAMVGSNGEVGGLRINFETKGTQKVIVESLAILLWRLDFIDLTEVGGH